MKKYNLITLLLLFLLVFGCKNGAKSELSREASVRESFAKETNASSPYRVTYHAIGDNKEILDIYVLEKVAPYANYDTIDLIVTDELKRQAKFLKFKKIVIKGGGGSILRESTINSTINLE